MGLLNYLRVEPVLVWNELKSTVALYLSCGDADSEQEGDQDGNETSSELSEHGEDHVAEVALVPLLFNVDGKSYSRV